MSRQFPLVSTRYGAPMGRHSSPSLNDAPRSVRLFKVRLDSGGYDDGGAYWGFPDNIYCAMDNEGSIQTVRAGSRNQAAINLDIAPSSLRKPLELALNYATAIIDGRAPLPHSWTYQNVVEWSKR